MKLKIAVIGVACAMALNCLAVDKYYLIESESSSKYKDATEFGFFKPERWSSNSASSGTILTKFDSSAEYHVKKNKTCKLYIKASSDASTNPKQHVFEGGVLVLGGGVSPGLIFNYMSSPSSIAFGNDGLRILCGGFILAHAANRTFITDGIIAVNTDDDAYANISFLYKNQKLLHNGTLSIPEGDTLSVGVKTENSGGGFNASMELPKVNSCAGVFGTINVVSVSNYVEGAFLDDYDATFSIASTTLPGTLSIGTNCRLKLLSGGDVLTVGTLSLSDNTWLEIPYGDSGMGRIDVTSTLTVGKKIHVIAPGYVEGMSKKIPILAAPEGTKISERDFMVESQNETMWLTVEKVNGKEVLYVNYPDVYQASNIAYLDSSESWSDGTITSQPGINYVVEWDGESDTRLHMPKDGKPYDFKGASLSIGYGAIFEWNYNDVVQEFSCPVLRMMNASILNGNKQARLRIKGGIVDFVSGYIEVGASNERTLHIDSEITGYADIRLTGLARGTSSSPHGYYSFNAENTNFYGRILLQQRYWKDATDKVLISYNKSCHLTVTNALSLGGNLINYEPMALYISRYGRFIVEGNTTLRAQSNRGIMIDENGCIEVSKLSRKPYTPYTFRMETPLAINGTFYKEGVGTLELAGNMAFGEDGLGETPEADKNNFIVTGGVVRVCSVGAVDGASMEFRPGSALELAVDFDNEELLACGIRNVKTDTPFVLAEGVEKLPVSFNISESDAPSTDFSIALMTVSSAAAQAVKVMLPAVENPFKSYSMTFTETVDEETKNVTFGYRFVYQGMKVIVR